MSLTDNNLWFVITCRYNGYSLGNISPGTGRIWLDDVYCRGTETDIASCTRRGWGYHNCGHNEDVSVRCTVPPTGGNMLTSCNAKDYTVIPEKIDHFYSYDNCANVKQF